MKKFLKKKISLLAIAFLVIGVAMMSPTAPVNAAISSGVIDGVSASDRIVNTTGADYSVTFDTNIGATATQLWVIFPAGYTITNGSLGTAAVSDGTNTGFILVDGVQRTVDNVIGDSDAKKITITLTSAYDLGTGTGTSFRFLTGIQNPSLIVDPGHFTIDSNAAVEVEQADIHITNPLTAGTASYLVVTGTGTQTAGTENELIVTAKDQWGNTATSYTGDKTLTFSGPALSPNSTEATIEGTHVGDSMATVAFASGVTDGSNLTLVAYKAEATTVDVSDGSLNSNGDDAYDLGLTVTPAAAATLSFTTEPSLTAVSGIALTQQPVVTAKDTWGNVDTNFTELITLTTASAGSLTNGTETAVSGVANFSTGDDLIYTNLADDETFILTAADADGGTNPTHATSAQVASDVLATKLAISTVSSAASTPNVRFADNITLTVSAVDAQGTLDNDDTSTFSVALDEASGSTVLTTTNNTGTLEAGTATISTMQITAVDLTASTIDGETLHLVATDTGGGPGTLTASADNTTLKMDFIATQLLITQQPSGAADVVNLTTQPIIKLADANNNIDTSAANDGKTVTATVTTANVSAAGTATKTISAGVATFADLQASVDGAFADGDNITFHFAEPTLGFTAVDATATPLDVVATKYVWTQDPAGPSDCISGLACDTQGIIKARDTHNNEDTGKTATITISVKTGGGALVGTAGQSMTGGSLTTTGIGYSATADDEQFTLAANDGSLAEGVTGTIESDVLATKLAITEVSGTGDNAVEFDNNITITVSALNAQDKLDNDDVSTFLVAVTDASDDNLPNLSFNGGTLVAGTKQLTTMHIDATDLTATTLDGAGLKLIASDTGVGSSLANSAADTTLTINFVASKLLVTQQPSGAVDEVALTTQPKVSAVDANNNVDSANSDEVITASTATANAGVGGVTTATMSSGVATFAGLIANVTGTFTDGNPITLTFNDDGGFSTLGDFAAVDAATTSLDVVATKLAFTQEPGATTVSGIALGTQPIVTAQDAHDNTDSGFTGTVTLIEDGDGVLTNDTEAAVAGVANFSTGDDLIYSNAADDETFTLTADDSGSLTAAVSTQLVASDVLATKLAITVASGAPDNAVSFGDNITVTVQAQNAQSKLDNDSTVSFTVVAHDASGDGLTETANTGTLVAGTATLATMKISAADLTATTVDGDAIHLQATDDVLGLTASAENTGTLTIDFIASKLLVTQQPSGAVDEVALTTQPKVSAVDANNNVDSANSDEVITASTATANAGVGGVTTATMSSGVATFAGLIANVTGTFTDGNPITLTFNDDGDFASIGNFDALDATATPLDVVATKYIWTQDPATCISGSVCGTQGIIRARDAHDNNDTGKAAAITLSVKTGGGSLVGTASQGMTSGTLTTSGIGYSATADQQAFTLAANDGSLTEGVSGSVTANVVATKFLVTLNTNTATAGTADALTLTAVDNSNITDTGYDPAGKSYSFLDSSVQAISSHVSPNSTAPTIPSNATIIAAFSNGTSTLPTFTLTKAEVLGAITATDGTLTGDSASVTVKHGATASFTVTPSTLTPNTNTTENVTVTAKDSSGNTADGANGATAFTGIVFLTTDATAPIWYNQVGNITSGGTKTFADSVKFSTVENDITITAENSGASVSGTSANIDVSAGPVTPTVAITAPTAGATISGTSTLTFTTNSGATTAAYVQIDGNSWASATNANPGTYSLDTTSLTNGSHTLRAKDTVSTLTGYSDYVTFLVSNGDSSAPVVNSITAGSIASTTATLTVVTNENATCRYATTDIAYASMTLMTTTTGVTTHTQALTGLTAATPYNYYVRCMDASNNTMTSSAHVYFTTLGSDNTLPTVSAQYPLHSSTDGAVWGNPWYYVDFSEAMLASTISTSTIKLCLVSDASCTSPIAANVQLSNGGTRATILTDASLSNNIPYWIKVSTGVKDEAGNALAIAYGSATASDFTTVALGDGSLAVTGITTTRSYATVGGDYAAGWAWTFNVTVPTSATSTQLKFDDWVSGANHIHVADNMRFYSSQASTAVDSAHAVSIAASGTDSAVMTLATTDLDASTDGQQIQITVEARVPDGSAGGSYSTQYGVTSN